MHSVKIFRDHLSHSILALRESPRQIKWQSKIQNSHTNGTRYTKMFTSFTRMFGLLEYPSYAYRYGYPYEPLLLSRRYRTRSPFDSYISAVHGKIAKLLYEEIFGPQTETEAATETEAQTETGHNNDNQPPRHIFSSSIVKSSIYAGDDVVEEHRERVMNEDGSVHVVTRRQIGDRWYVHESHSDKDGASSTKETWHNVAEDDIDAFKKEWEDRKASALPQSRETQEALPQTEDNE